LAKELNQMKKKVLFICLHRPDRSPSQRFRFEQYINHLEKEGFDCKHVFLLSEKGDKTFYSAGKLVQKGLILFNSLWKLTVHSFFRKYDIVFVQREAFMLGTSFFERKFSKRAKLIFDFDDAIWKTQTGDVKSKNKLLYFLKNPDKTKDIINSASMVFAGNQYLADYAKLFNENIRIIPTTIDTDIYSPVSIEKKQKICIGWSGSFSTIIHFEHILEPLIALKKKYEDNIYFKVIGDGNFENSELKILGIPWIKATEVEELGEIAIGVMPLPDDEWTNGKCALKGLQYMALGIPTIVSPVGVNREVIQEGVNGYFATSQKEWVEKLSLLIDSPSLRKQIGLEGRKVVEKNYSVHANKHLYVEYFNEVLKS
jgi:glycosyltransferase involved in cell wall biosynthesis